MTPLIALAILAASAAPAEGIVPPPLTAEAPPPASSAERPRQGELSGTLRERGTRRKLSGIEIDAGGVSAVTDAEGRFRFAALPEGPRHLVVVAPGFKRFELDEKIADAQRLEVAYLLEPL